MGRVRQFDPFCLGSLVVVVKLRSGCDRGVPPMGGMVTGPFRSLC
jgi:hypothetical protein